MKGGGALLLWESERDGSYSQGEPSLGTQRDDLRRNSFLQNPKAQFSPGGQLSVIVQLGMRVMVQ